MSDFWAMSDLDKTLLVLKILLIGYGWASLILGMMTIMCFIMLLAKDYLDSREERWRDESQETIPLPKQTRRHISNENDELFRNVQELQDDLR